MADCDSVIDIEQKIINLDIFSNLVILQFKIKFKLVISYIFQLKVFRYIFQLFVNVNMTSALPVTTCPSKGNSVNLRTFESWGKSGVIGRKTIMVYY